MIIRRGMFLSCEVKKFCPGNVSLKHKIQSYFVLSLQGVAPLSGGQHERERRVLWLRGVRLRGLWSSQRHRWDEMKSKAQSKPR